jgi:death-on-curing protein
MSQPWFLNIDHTMRLHRSLIETYGGSEGVRDVGLLHSALAMPQASFGGEFLHRDLFEMAAAYLYHIVQNHPFIDGNKRVGAAAAIIFLSMNDMELTVDEDALVDLVLQVACGTVGKPEITTFLRTHTRPSPSVDDVR